MLTRLLVALGWLALGAALTTGWFAWQRPDLLIDTANVTWCG